MLDLCLLGCGGSLPLPNRCLTSLLASYNGKMILIDCGEGTQVSMRQIGWGFKAIEAICLTHYHADHVVGLPGILLTIGNSGREEPLTIIGPPGLKQVIQGLTVIAPVLPYDLHLIELPANHPASFQMAGMHIDILPVLHNIPCVSYTLEIQRGQKFLPERARDLNIPITLWKHLQQGNTVEHSGNIFTPDMVLGPHRKGIKVSYCTDTRPVPELVEFIRDADLFICEGMYGEEEKLPNAIENRHMLFREAAALAGQGNVRELWLTHFSPSITDPEEFANTARVIFPNTHIGYDRMMGTLQFEQNHNE